MKAVVWTLLGLVVCLFAFVRDLPAQDFDFQATQPVVAPFNVGLVAASIHTGFLNSNFNELRGLQPNGLATINTIDVGIGDINGDGFNDIISAQATTLINNNIDKNCILIFLGAGDGTFQLPRIINTISRPVALELTDLEGDRLTDIVIAEDGFIEVMTGLFFVRGAKSFDRFGDPNAPNGALRTKAGNQIISTSTGILDLDNILDIAVAEQGETNAEIEVFFTSITGGFNPDGVADLNLIASGSIVGQTSLGQSVTTKAIAIEMANISDLGSFSDGDFDIFLATSFGVEIFENNLLDFIPLTTLANAGSATALIVKDLNFDGFPEIISISQSLNRVTIFKANPGGGYTTPRPIPVDNPIAVTTINFNNDDLADLAILQARSSVPASITILLGDINTLFTNRMVLNNINGIPLVNPFAIAIGQGIPLGEEIAADDIVLAESTPSNTSTGGVLFLPSANNLLPIFLQVVTNISPATDFDGIGGNNDLAIMEQNLGIIYLLYNITTDGAEQIVPIVIGDMFTDSFLRPTSLTTFFDPNIGLNNIAVTVIARNNNDTSTGQLIVLLNDGVGNFGNDLLFRQFVATTGPTNIMSADFNQDGASDLVYIDYASSLAVTAMNDGTNLFLDLKFRETGGFIPVSAQLSDVNDDDIPDLMVINQGNVSAGNQSLVSVLIGKMDGSFILTSLIAVPNIAISIAGGQADFFGDGRPQIVDFNGDGFPDFAVASSRTSAISNSIISSVTLLINQPSQPGNFIVQPPIPLFDDTINGFPGLILEDRLGGPGIVTGRGGQTGLGFAFGGANFLMAAGDFNADGFSDLVVTGSQLNQGNFRSSIYLVGNATAGTMRTVRPQRSPQYGGSDPFIAGADTFIGCVSGWFTNSDFFNGAADVLHVSVNGSIWIDANNTRILNHAPRIIIDRKDLNAEFGKGKKQFVTAGEIVTIPVIGDDIEGDPVTFSLVPTPTGQQPPRFVTIDTIEGQGVLTIDTSLFSQTGPNPAIFRIAVQGTDLAQSGTGGRQPLFNRDYFTLIVQPNNPPIIQPIPEQTVAVDNTVIVSLLVNDPENDEVIIDVVCDKNQFVIAEGTDLTIAPTIEDLGLNVCAVTATDIFGLSSTVGLTINVVPRAKENPIIDQIDDQIIGPIDVIEIPVTSFDPEGDENLTLSLLTAPDFVNLIDNGDGTGTIILMPNLFSPAFSNVVVQVTTSDNRFATTSFNIIIDGVFIVDAVFDKQMLFIQGRDYGINGAQVIINDQDVSQQIISQSNFSLTLKGSKRKLNLQSGDNLIQVMVENRISDAFILTLE